MLESLYLEWCLEYNPFVISISLLFLHLPQTLSSFFIHFPYLISLHKVKDRVSDVDGEFTDSRVLELWEQAQRSGFRQEELDSIKVFTEICHTFIIFMSHTTHQNTLLSLFSFIKVSIFFCSP